MRKFPIASLWRHSGYNSFVGFPFPCILDLRRLPVLSWLICAPVSFEDYFSLLNEYCHLTLSSQLLY
jgi:hypothetical protein